MSIIDCEWGWRFNHEDLTVEPGRRRRRHGGAPTTNHGTAVHRRDQRRPERLRHHRASARTPSSGRRRSPARRRRRSAARPTGSAPATSSCWRSTGPGRGTTSRVATTSSATSPIEWWPDDFAAIRYASSRGHHRRRGRRQRRGEPRRRDLRHPSGPGSRPRGATRSTARTATPARSSSAPARRRPGPTASDHGPDRSRLDFSNYGALIDAQGWGREVTSTGLRRPAGRGRPGSGTPTGSAARPARPRSSSASSAALQGVLRAGRQDADDPATARAWLRGDRLAAAGRARPARAPSGSATGPT